MVSPVIFPPGRARLATSPAGSATYVKTIGIVWVAFFAAWDAAAFIVRMTSTLRRTNPAARSERFRVGLRESVLNGDVLAFNVA